MSKRIEHHYSKGEPKPDIASEYLAFFTMQFCPYARRVALALSHFDIIHQRIHINIRSKPDWFMRICPNGLVPTIALENEVLDESEEICKYLNQINLKKNLFSYKTDDASLDETEHWFNDMFPLHQRFLTEEEVPQDVQEQYIVNVNSFESLPGLAYIGEERKEVGYADFIAYPIVEMMPFAYKRMAKLTPIDGYKHERLSRFYKKMLKLPAVRNEQMCEYAFVEYALKFYGINVAPIVL